MHSIKVIVLFVCCSVAHATVATGEDGDTTDISREIDEIRNTQELHTQHLRLIHQELYQLSIIVEKGLGITHDGKPTSLIGTLLAPHNPSTVMLCLYFVNTILAAANLSYMYFAK